jgi:negative regulator of flagellin synthesis FlgM
MKIDNSFKTLTTGTLPPESGRLSKKTVPESSEATVRSDVQFSSLASHLQAIEQGFADTPVVNAARVAELKQAIGEGRFKVDADKVADRLLRTVQDLINAHKA